MKKYIANYTNGRGESWDLVFMANSYKEALKEARKAQHGLMAGDKLNSIHLMK